MVKQKGWLVKQSFTNEFVDCLDMIYQKYGEEVFEIQGIANKYMDLVKFSKEFFKKSADTNVADLSVDDNANVCEKNVIQYDFENNKALMRLNSLYMMFKTIKDIKGLEEAQVALEKVINGEIFVNDLHTYATKSYCYSFDLRNLLLDGMSFFKGNMNIKPPKRSDSFISLVIQATAYISNQIAGAVSYPSFFLLLDHFYRKERGEDYIKKIRDVKLSYIDDTGITITQYIPEDNNINVQNKITKEITNIKAKDFNDSLYYLDIDSL